MKSLIVTLFTLCITVIGQAQQYQSFPTKNAYWIYVKSKSPSGPYPRYTYYQYILNGDDTTVNGKTYKKVVLRTYIDSTIYDPNSANYPYRNYNPPSYTNKIANKPDSLIGGIRGG